MKLAYEAFDQAGRSVTDTIDADDTTAATELLRGQGLYVTRIDQTDESSTEQRTRPIRRRQGPGKRLRNVASFARQLHVLIASGTTLVPALSALARQAGNERWRAVLQQLRDEVEQGVSLSEAMKDQPDDFDSITRSLVAAGESAGNLEAMLDRLAVLKRKQLHVYRLVVGSLTYPILLIFVSLSVLLLLMMFVLPRFTMMFDMLDAPLPPSTQALVLISYILRSFWWAFLILAIGAGIGIKMYLGSVVGKRSVDWALIHFPLIGPVMRNLVTARIVRLLGVLLDSHVSLLEALSLTREAAGNVYYEELVTTAEEAATQGDALSSALAKTDLISPSVLEAIRGGEQSGQMGTLLCTIADFQDEDNEVIVRALTNVIGPLILVMLGLVVGFVAISLFLPLFDLTSMTSPGGGA